MPIYLAPWIGSGSKEDPFRPLGVDGQSTFSCLDLRPDPSKQAGYCIVSVPNPIVDSNAIDLGTTADHLSSPVRNRIQQLLESKTIDDLTVGEIIGQLLLDPPPGKWARLLPTAGQYEVWLDNQLIFTKPT